MSRTNHPRGRGAYNKRELHRPGGGYLPPGRFSKTRVHRLARRVPPLALEDYEWPTAEELLAADEAFWDWYEPRDWLDDGVYARDDETFFGPRDDDDFEDVLAPELGYLDDFERAWP